MASHKGGDFSLSHYQFIKTLGKGRFSKVKLARHLATEEMVAVKIVSKVDNTEKDMTILMQEMRILKMLDHPNIVKLYEVLESPSDIYMVMEYIHGDDLSEWANRQRKKKDFMDQVRYVFYRLSDALAYCHRHRVVHRDIKPQNILVNKLCHPKLADWGLSNTFGDLLATHCGTPFFAAPELFLKQAYEGPPIDVWALGVNLYLTVGDRYPFMGDSVPDFVKNVVEGKYTPLPNIDPSLQDLLQRMLCRFVKDRITADELLTHPWFAEERRKDCETGDGGHSARAKRESDGHLNPDVILVMTELLNYKEEDIVKTIEGHKFDSIAATYYLLRDTEYLPDYVELARMQKSGAQFSSASHAGPARRKSSLMNVFKKGLGVQEAPMSEWIKEGRRRHSMRKSSTISLSGGGLVGSMADMSLHSSSADALPSVAERFKRGHSMGVSSTPNSPSTRSHAEGSRKNSKSSLSSFRFGLSRPKTAAVIEGVES